ncbi:MAG: putative DNA modification/repair radical SAM protein [Lachnospiraceae bacterium]|jgi:putative DNA modification/repair radical SAM protein|nr:putative DNA modification/repair radical SAM protein [Lachnospiraceae bacterium]
MNLQINMDLFDKLTVLSAAAKYDVACTSSGVDRQGSRSRGMGNTIAPGICHSFSADGRCISLLKILLTNECIFNCAYCLNNRDSDVPRTSFTPEEICTITMEFYRRNYIEGLFLSSGIMISPDYTMDLIYQTVYRLRTLHHFHGYIHVKAIPGADPYLVEKTGFLADRMSVNLELPTADSLKQLAPCKSRHTILKPMRQIQNRIADNKQELIVYHNSPKFVPAGQSTQMIIGATSENDFQIMSVAEGLYQNFHLKRVFYSAFVNVNNNSMLPTLPGGPPLLREHRLYQADWLLRYYHFEVSELLSADRPDFNIFLDPKCDWALRHLEYFPVEINRASYQTLLRVPGIGYKSAERIVKARRRNTLNFDDLKKIGVVLKRALYFITCAGKMMYHTKLDENYICENLMRDKTQIPKDIRQGGYQQLSFFDKELQTDFQLTDAQIIPPSQQFSAH